MAKFKPPGAAVLAARARRDVRGTQSSDRTEWFIKEVSDKISFTLKQRVQIVTELIKTATVKNISRPVTKGTDGVVTERSIRGEFPKADTTQLIKTIFTDLKQVSKGSWDGFVGTPLDYGVTLELEMDRRFLSRTLDENRSNVLRILTGPIKG